MQMPESSLFHLPGNTKYRLARGSIKLLLGLQVLMAVIVISALLLTTNHTRQVLLENNLIHAREHADNLEARLTQSFGLLQLHIRSLQLANQSKDRQLNELTSLQEKLVYIRSLSLLDANGQIILSTNSANQGLQPELGQLLPAGAPRNTQLLRFANPWQGRDFADGKQSQGDDDGYGREFFPLLSNLADSSELRLLLAINSDYFINLASGHGDNDTFEQNLYTDNGVLLFSTNKQKPAGASLISAEHLAMVQNTLSGSGIWLDQDQQEQLQAYRASKNYPWFVQSQISLKQSLQGWQQTNSKLWLHTLLTLALMLLITGYMTYRVNRSVQLQERRQEALRLASSVFVHSSDMILIADNKRRIIASNPAFEQGIGFTIRDVLGHQLGNLQPELEPCPMYEQAWQHVKDYGSWQGEVTEVRKDGSDIAVWLSINVIRDNQGRVVNYVAVMRDLSRIRADEDKIRRLSLAVEQSPSSIVITSPEAKIEYANPQFYRATGYQPDEVIGANPRILQSGLTPYKNYINMWQQISRGQVWHGDFVNKRKDGSFYYERASVSPLLDNQGNISGYLGVKHDITAEKEAEQKMRLAASVIDSTNEGVMICNSDNKIIDVNPAFSQITGYSREEALGRNPEFLSSENRNAEQYEDLYKALADKGHWQGEFWNRNKNGANYVIFSTINQIIDETCQVSHYVSVFSDITEQKNQQKSLEKQAHYDLLTGLPNRLLLQDRLKQAMARALRQQHCLAVCFMDLDGFKAVNDNHGHEAGDELLVAVAQRLQQSIRAEDTAARLGGDEFVLLLERVHDFDSCEQIVLRVLEAVRQPLTLSTGAQVGVTASIGITFYPQDDGDSDQLLRNADRAMYRAKQGGRDCYEVSTKVKVKNCM